MREAVVHRGIVQSLQMKAIRDRVSELARELSVPAVFLKGAWSEPVLYRGHATRFVSDVDLLVPETDFTRFADGLEGIGYRRVLYPEHRVSNDHAKEWSFRPQHRGGLTIDLHRRLANPPYRLDPSPLIARARWYDSEDGPVLSLDATDQAIYAAAHYANHHFDLDRRHRDDIALLEKRAAIDWLRAERVAVQGGFGFALRWLRSELDSDLPHLYEHTTLDRLRVSGLRWARTLPPTSVRSALCWIAEGVVYASPLHPVRSALRYAYYRAQDRTATRQNTAPAESARGASA
ncbi:MAG: nucleotidyltransferase family protein [Myxococcota bacterium]